LIDSERLVEAARVMGDFADLKSAHLAGHSSGVANLAAAAAERRGINAAEISELHVAALAHDLGRVTVSTSAWDKAAPLNESEWEAVRLHAYYSERMLGRAQPLAGVARVAGMHHEHVDGSGYHRGNIAMRASRAYRPALDPDRAGAELRKLAEDDRLDAVAVNAVLNAAGDHGPQVRRRWPAGLTDREVDVLRRVALGGSIQDAAIALYLAPKTVDFHLQNIYSKVGVSTRAAATLFAIQNGLLQP
jgi:HD-GYP domain-containing protein (c-di-GMP phosphodiesterase class II)